MKEEQLELFNYKTPWQIRKEIERKMPKYHDEDYDDWLETIRIETDFELSKRLKVHPDYSSHNIDTEFIKEFKKQTNNIFSTFQALF